MKLMYAPELEVELNNLYAKGMLYPYLEGGPLYGQPVFTKKVHHPWKGKMKKQLLGMMLDADAWCREWEDAERRLSPYGAVFSSKKEGNYKVYGNVQFLSAEALFHYLGKTGELLAFTLYVSVFRKELKGYAGSVLGQFYADSGFREKVYGLFWKEPPEVAAKMAAEVMLAVFDRVQHVPDEPEYARLVVLPHLGTKFFETHLDFIKMLYNIVTGENIRRSDDLLGKMNIVNYPPVYLVQVPGKHNEVKHMSIRELEGQLSPVPKKVLLVENKAMLYGYHYGDVLAIGGTGKSIVYLARQSEWLKKVPVIYYWGDCDADGYLMLDGVRENLPQTQSVFMEDFFVSGLLSTREDLFVEDAGSMLQKPLTALILEEAKAYDVLRSRKLRLEQERVPRQAVRDMIACINKEDSDVEQGTGA